MKYILNKILFHFKNNITVIQDNLVKYYDRKPILIVLRNLENYQFTIKDKCIVEDNYWQRKYISCTN